MTDDSRAERVLDYYERYSTYDLAEMVVDLEDVVDKTRELLREAYGMRPSAKRTE